MPERKRYGPSTQAFRISALRPPRHVGRDLGRRATVPTSNVVVSRSKVGRHGRRKSRATGVFWSPRSRIPTRESPTTATTTPFGRVDQRDAYRGTSVWATQFPRPGPPLRCIRFLFRGREALVLSRELFHEYGLACNLHRQGGPLDLDFFPVIHSNRQDDRGFVQRKGDDIWIFESSSK